MQDRAYDVTGHGRRKAFTVVELLVVMSIIVLLLALLLPSMRNAREVTRIATCAANVHQLQASFLAYAGDELGFLPNTRSYEAGNNHDRHHMLWVWSKDMGDYLRNTYLGGDYRVMLCPAADRHHPDPEKYWSVGYANDTQSRWTGYVSATSNRLNTSFFESITPDGHDVYCGKVSGPRSTNMLLSDTLYHTTDYDATRGDWTWRWSTVDGNFSTHPGSDDVGFDRARGANVGLIDGSVSWKNIDDTAPQVRHKFSWAWRQYYW
ncbi:MAG: prepilin-type N-terminal cleavage/methylation domain-containing protein [Phycisphaera sp.]|nr:prepilin-type N-terminal cleavage/methylation domain-containing protein [Phycisphaera sp.]